ncbi:cytochrome-c peroxidase [Tellurirhabdus bombi]|uniref:cytochrome-c peroxidase n=1 Tax=Tellurirhabdus bombi TaxID=2907205 RepID=UPI001F38D7A9|nr:cytochrome c peroxidase [Tellurirhabdus bombi]
MRQLRWLLGSFTGIGAMALLAWSPAREILHLPKNPRTSQLEPYPFIYPAAFGNRFTIPDNNPLTKQGVYLGRLLFYETRLSSTNKISCGSCHQQHRAFTDGLPFSTGVSGRPTRRNSMSLANLLWVRNFFWDGRARSLEDQALIPLSHPDEMGQPAVVAARKLQQMALYPPLFKQVFGSDIITPERMIRAIAQFERTLISANSPYDAYLRGQYVLSEAESRGLKLFTTAPAMERQVRGGNCAHCHGGPKLYQEVFHNNGLDRIPKDPGRREITGMEQDQGRFRVPTLRNITLTAPYMHDGRFASLEEVLDHYSDHIQASSTLSPELMPTDVSRNQMTPQEKQDLIAFLHLFTDQGFITNPAFSDPHLTHLSTQKSSLPPQKSQSSPRTP